jgi:hypothetical protein
MRKLERVDRASGQINAGDDILLWLAGLDYASLTKYILAKEMLSTTERVCARHASHAHPIHCALATTNNHTSVSLHH